LFGLCQVGTCLCRSAPSFSTANNGKQEQTDYR
jgi:hypothetical protein